jgi:hypothetical protein
MIAVLMSSGWRASADWKSVAATFLLSRRASQSASAAASAAVACS